MKEEPSRQAIIQLMRGIASCPVISSLESCGVLELFAFGPVTAESVPNIRPERLAVVFEYLTSLGLVTSTDRGFVTTALGQSVFSRAGSFQILTSYLSHFGGLEGWLTDAVEQPHCDRRLNVLGSGEIHRKKFFPTAAAWAAAATFDVIVDLGCGDGAFLNMLLDQDPRRAGLCVDLSQIAVDETIARLAGRRVQGFIANALDVDLWSRDVDPDERLLDLALVRST